MGSSPSKVRKSQVNKVLPETSAAQENVLSELETKNNPSDETLSPVRLVPYKQSVLPAISSKVQNNRVLEDRPDCSVLHANDEEDDEFQNVLDADLQLNLDQDRTYIDEEKMLKQELKETKKQLETLRKDHEELQESHAKLRQEMLNMRKLNLDDRISSQKTLINEESNVTTLKNQIEQLKSENLNLSRATEQQIQFFTVKMNNQRSKYSARVFELEQKLKVSRFDREMKDLSLPSLNIPKINHLEVIEDLKKQLSMKNQIIKDLSVELMEVNSEISN